jgi:hypothetical protein
MVWILKTYRVTNGFVGGIMPNLQVGVVQCLLAADTLSRVEAKHLRKEINSKMVRMREQSEERNVRLYWERSNIILRLQSKLSVF